MESCYYVPMSGSNTICTVTVLLETGMIAMKEPKTVLVLDTPGGLVRVTAACRNGKCERVTFRNVPSFVFHLDRPVEVAGLGTITLDASYGGMIYAIVDARVLGFSIVPSEARDLVAMGERIKAAAAEQLPAVHPENPEIHTINQTLFAGPLTDSPAGGKTARNAVIVSPGRIDRSPCGTGTCARLTVLHAKGMIATGEVLDHVSIIDSHFAGRVEEVTAVGGKSAERHLRHVLLSCMTYDNEARTHVSLDKDAPIPREVKVSAGPSKNLISADCITNTSGSDLRQGQVMTSQ